MGKMSPRKFNIEKYDFYVKEYIRKTKLNEFEKSYGKRYSKTFTQAEVIVCNIIINHMQKLEEGEK